MRWFGGLIIVGLCGCTALNGNYAGAQGAADTDGPLGSTGLSGTGGGPSSASGGGVTSNGMDSAPSVDSVGTDPSGADTSGTSDSHGNDESDTGWYDTSGESTSNGGSSETGGSPAARFTLLYSAEAWSGTNDDLGVIDAAYQLCSANALDDCSLDDEPVPLLRLGETTAPELLIAFGDGLDDPVVGPTGIPIASDIDDLFNGTIDRTLAEAGLDSFGEEWFWTGGVGVEPTHCFNWSAPPKKGLTGVAGSFLVVETWFDDADLPCPSTLPIVCACRSVEDPF